MSEISDQNITAEEARSMIKYKVDKKWIYLVNKIKSAAKSKNYVDVDYQNF